MNVFTLLKRFTTMTPYTLSTNIKDKIISNDIKIKITLAKIGEFISYYLLMLITKIT